MCVKFGAKVGRKGDVEHQSVEFNSLRINHHDHQRRRSVAVRPVELG